MASSTRPVHAAVSFEAYCESIGVELGEARSATVSRALLAQLTRQDAALERAANDTRRQAQARRSACEDE